LPRDNIGPTVQLIFIYDSLLHVRTTISGSFAEG
jgi:hypothetical protein